MYKEGIYVMGSSIRWSARVWPASGSSFRPRTSRAHREGNRRLHQDRKKYDILHKTKDEVIAKYGL